MVMMLGPGGRNIITDQVTFVGICIRSRLNAPAGASSSSSSSQQTNNSRKDIRECFYNVKRERRLRQEQNPGDLK